MNLIAKLLMRLRRKPVVSMDAEWGKDDCVTHALGIDFDRPECIRTDSQESAFVRAVKQYGGVDAMCAEFARRGAYRRVTDGSRRIGDVVVGATVNEAFCIAKVDGQYLPRARTLCGYEVVQFVNIIGEWRRE